MRCSEIHDLLVAYEAGELTLAQQEFVQLHVEGCAACRQSLADLQLTRRQLETLKSDRYRPQLSHRIARAVKRKRAGGLAKAAASIAAVALLAVLAWRQGAIPGLPAPGGPPPGTTAYLLQAERLLEVDTGRKETAVVQPASWNAQLVSGGGTRLLLNEGRLTAIGPNSIARTVGPAEGRLAGISPDGRTAYLVWEGPGNRWRVDRIDLATGALTRGSETNAGQIHTGIVSADGSRVYLLATVDGVSWVKEVESSTGAIAKVHKVAGFEKGGTLLLNAGGSRLYIVGNGPVAAISPGTDGEFEAMLVNGATPNAVLVPGTTTILTTHTSGGLMQINIDPFPATKRIPGEFYTKLLWGEEGAWLYALSGSRLDVLDPKSPAKPLSRISLGK